MNRDRQKQRIPTSEELERKGALVPAADQSTDGRRGLLQRFYRPKRFRVSADVAARKYVGVPPIQPSITPPPATQPAVAETSLPGLAPEMHDKAEQLPARQTEQPGNQSRRRTIRIDDSIRQRRGLGNREKN